jgi:N-acetylglucosaminyl-diphospho-decaprenol L-rhamnosyltransferase
MDMLLSVVIINYNVKYFLEQCLYSVEKALGVGGKAGQGGAGSVHGEGIYGRGEILVVDNHSSDGSLEYLRDRFPGVQFIANEENIGFSRANNQALGMAKGKYILFLNPDTIVGEDSLSVCMAFLESTPGAGAVGIRMIDGSGRFLKESRRGFPTPWVAFCKLAGLTAMFPRSRWLAGYYLGHLQENETHRAPVLSGAFFMTAREILEKTGGFDEQFFMYAEDIDLSYRIEQAGYRNYYVAGTTILHFKGESTRKDARYVKLFYKAMSQFRHKHFKGVFSGLFNGLLEIAIWLRAGLSAVLRLCRKDFSGRGVAPGDFVYRTWVTGDPEEAKRIGDLLMSSGSRKVVNLEKEVVGMHEEVKEGKRAKEHKRVNEHQGANEIIFCEGNLYSFRDIINSLQKPSRRIPCKIHALGSFSIVGSHSKDGRGDTIVL